MKQIKVKTKRMRQNVKDIMREEVEEILNTMDFTNYEIQVHYDEKTNTTIIPKPVFALTFVNAEVREWVFSIINLNPGCVMRIE